MTSKILIASAVFAVMASSSLAQWLPRFDDTDFCRPTVIANPSLLCCQGVVYSDSAVKYGCCDTRICDLYTGQVVDASKLTKVGSARQQAAANRQQQQQPDFGDYIEQPPISGAPLTMITRMEGTRQQIVRTQVPPPYYPGAYLFQGGPQQAYVLGAEPVPVNAAVVPTAFAQPVMYPSGFAGDQAAFVPAYSPLRFFGGQPGNGGIFVA